MLWITLFLSESFSLVYIMHQIAILFILFSKYILILFSYMFTKEVNCISCVIHNIAFYKKDSINTHNSIFLRSNRLNKRSYTTKFSVHQRIFPMNRQTCFYSEYVFKKSSLDLVSPSSDSLFLFSPLQLMFSSNIQGFKYPAQIYIIVILNVSCSKSILTQSTVLAILTVILTHLTVTSSLQLLRSDILGSLLSLLFLPYPISNPVANRTVLASKLIWVQTLLTFHTATMITQSSPTWFIAVALQWPSICSASFHPYTTLLYSLYSKQPECAIGSYRFAASNSSNDFPS